MVSENDIKLCEFCATGDYGLPFERFELLAVFRDGPTFLKRCKLCGALWDEDLRSARLVSVAEAIALYPSVTILVLSHPTVKCE